jgi:hypothetical protein
MENIIEKYIDDVKSWGILTLMTKMKNSYLRKLEKDRDVICGYQTQDYENSPLQNLDRYIQAFEETYHREFTKIYDQVVKEHESKE